MEIGTNAVGIATRPNYTILAAAPGYLPTAEGLTLDITSLTAEVASRTLKSGYVTAVGEFVIPAGTTLYALSPGTAGSKYGVAITATTLAQGETFVTTKDWSYAWDTPQISATASAEVILSRLLVGGSGQPTLANVRAAMPTLRIKNV